VERENCEIFHYFHWLELRLKDKREPDYFYKYINYFLVPSDYLDEIAKNECMSMRCNQSEQYSYCQICLIFGIKNFNCQAWHGYPINNANDIRIPSPLAEPRRRTIKYDCELCFFTDECTLWHELCTVCLFVDGIEREWCEINHPYGIIKDYYLGQHPDVDYDYIGAKYYTYVEYE
jgi:hypothetical protein